MDLNPQFRSPYFHQFILHHLLLFHLRLKEIFISANVLMGPLQQISKESGQINWNTLVS